MSWTFTTSGAALIKAGVNANARFNISGDYIPYLTTWSDEAEAVINTLTRRDWIALSGQTTTNFKKILSDVCSDMIAMKIINYDMSGYTTLAEATTMLDVLRDNITRNIENLKEEKVKEKMF